jgi:hypothetical protein
MQLPFDVRPRFEIAGLERSLMSDQVRQFLAASRHAPAQRRQLARGEGVNGGFDFCDGRHGANQRSDSEMST